MKSSTPVTLLERLRQADTGDLVQDVFLVLTEALPTFHYDPNRSFRSWLRAITLNKWRQQRRRAALPVQAGVDPDELPDPAEDFWETEYQQQLAARALRLMHS